MFFYSFDSETGKLNGISNMFLPPSDTVLCFPSGLTYTEKGDIMVAYGDADAKCKYFTTHVNEVQEFLKNTKKIKPDDIKFVMAEITYKPTPKQTNIFRRIFGL